MDQPGRPDPLAQSDRKRDPQANIQGPPHPFCAELRGQILPSLLNKAWTADNLNAQLDSRARMFINNPDYNQLSGNPVYVSKIFDWYAADFGNLIDFLNQYAAQSVPEDARIEYREYDWALNK